MFEFSLLDLLFPVFREELQGRWGGTRPWLFGMRPNRRGTRPGFLALDRTGEGGTRPAFLALDRTGEENRPRFWALENYRKVRSKINTR